MIRVEFLPHFADGRLPPMEGILDGLRGPLRDYGIDWGCDQDAADLIWTNQQQVAARPGRPIIMHEVRDSGTINWTARSSVAQPNVILAVKASAYRPRDLVNATHFEHSYHGSLIYRSAPEVQRPKAKPAPLHPAIDCQHLDKVRLGYNWLFHPCLNALAANRATNVRRDIDVFFAGTMNYPRWHIVWHRKRAASMLETLPGCSIAGPVRFYPHREYQRILWRSRIVLSPWGFGETCIRDLEALLAGAVLVKPETRFSETWPEYHRLDTCRFCRADFSDLAEVTSQILDGWSDLQGSRYEAARWLRQLRNPMVLSQRVAGLIHEATAKM